MESNPFGQTPVPNPESPAASPIQETPIQDSKIKKLIQQFAKFFLIGIMNTLLDLLILNIETILTGAKSGYPFAIQKGVSFLVAVCFSYFMNKYWAFQDKDKEKQAKKFSQFLFVSLIGMGINMTAATVAVTYVQPLIHINALTPQLWVTIGGLCGSAAGLLWNFVGYKFWVFKK